MGQAITLDKPLGPPPMGYTLGEEVDMANVRPCSNSICSHTSKTSPAMLKTPHGWLCSLCFRALHKLA